MTADLAPTVRRDRRFQRPHRGECRRHPRGAGLRQRGPRARAVRREQPELSRAPSSTPTGIMAGQHVAELPVACASSQVIVMIAGSLVRLSRRADAPAASSASCCWSTCSSGRSRRSTRCIETYPKGIAGFRRYIEFIDTEPDIADRPGAVDGRAACRATSRYRDVSLRLYSEQAGARRASTSRSAPARRSPSSAHPAPARRRSARCCRASTRSSGGAIRIDGIDIRDMTLASLRGQIGIVQQDVFLFGGTIRENIAYGRLDASDAEIVEAARRAALDDVIAVAAGRARHRRSASAASSSPAARSSAWRSPACS